MTYRSTRITFAVLLSAVVLGGCTAHSGAVRGPADPAPGPSSRVSWLPGHVTLSRTPERPLPVDRPVGAAGLVYVACVGCDHAVLVLPDASRYQVPARANPYLPGVALSPDGRWLAYPGGVADTVLRDLTGTTVVTLPGQTVRYWSADSRWLVSEEYHGLSYLVDLTTLAAPRKVTGLDPGAPPFYGEGLFGKPEPSLALAGILGSGQLLFAGSPAGDTEQRRLRVVVTDADALHIVRDWTIAVPGGAAWSGVLRRPVFADATGERLVADTAPGRYQRATAVAVLDGRTGAVAATRTLPTPHGNDDFWSTVAYVDGDAVLVHRTRTGLGVGLLDPGTGAPRTVCVLDGADPVPGAVVLRGMSA
jgi:hypothetical protein